MDLKQAADLLNGGEYRLGAFKASDVHHLREAGIVAVTGESDDIVALYGAISDEGGFEVPFLDGEVFENSCAEEDCPYFLKLKAQAKCVKATFNEYGEDSPTWQFEVPFPHETFDIMEDGQVFSRGAVFYLKDT
jgi:hypothetical protein